MFHIKQLELVHWDWRRFSLPLGATDARHAKEKAWRRLGADDRRARAGGGMSRSVQAGVTTMDTSCGARTTKRTAKRHDRNRREPSAAMPRAPVPGRCA